MTLQEIKLLVAYSAWATHRVFDAIAKMPEGDLHKNMNSSHASIHGTLLHMVSAERTWLARLQGQKDPPRLGPEEAPSLATAKSIWENVGFEMAKFVGGLTDRKLQDPLKAASPAGQVYTHQCWQVIHHVVDHSTYHRGQVITLMRQLGGVPPVTGLIVFFRETQKAS